MSNLSPAVSPAARTVPPPPALSGEVTSAPSNKHGFTFHDFLNIFNPLQHIPVVSTIYREITGDTLKPISSILGGALFGGVAGLVGSAVDAIVQETTGADIGGHIMATLGFHHDKNATAAQTTQAQPSNAQFAQAAAQSVQAGMPKLGASKAVPALLVAEAAADRASHKGAIGPAGSAPIELSEEQSSALFRSLQRGGNGTTRAPAATPLVVPPGMLTDGRSGGSRAAAVLAAAKATAAAPIPNARPTASAVPPASVAQGDAAAQSQVQPVQPAAPFQTTPNGGVQPLPRQAIPEMMMQALAKYEAMNKAPQASSVDQIH